QNAGSFLWRGEEGTLLTRVGPAAPGRGGPRTPPSLSPCWKGGVGFPGPARGSSLGCSPRCEVTLMSTHPREPLVPAPEVGALLRVLVVLAVAAAVLVASGGMWPAY